jgi:restriction system protein
MTTWMVRAGRKGHLFDQFIDEGIVTIGWKDMGAVEPGISLDELKTKMLETWPDWHPQKISMSAGQVNRFINEIRAGDTIVTYDPSQRIYKIGVSKGEYRYDPSVDSDDHGHILSVDWQRDVPRDVLQPRTKNSLGAISTLFKIPNHAAEDLTYAADGKIASGSHFSEEDGDGETESSTLGLDAVETRAADLIADRLSRLGWSEMQDLVAGVLRGMGYKTEVSPKGADRGKDIIASPDGFGFQDPRIIVEVKHRVTTAMGAPEIRAFLGGRRDGDKCLYVSTGGFTREARYEAERARYPLKLMTLEDLTEVILSDYECLDSSTKALIPLTRVYWPT